MNMMRKVFLSGAIALSILSASVTGILGNAVASSKNNSCTQSECFIDDHLGTCVTKKIDGEGYCFCQDNWDDDNLNTTCS